MSSFVFFGIVAWDLGVQEALLIHHEWLNLISRDLSRVGKLDLRSTLMSWGCPVRLAWGLWVATCLGCVGLAWRCRNQLLSPEPPSFVFLAPVYAWGMMNFSKARRWEQVIFVFGLVIMSLIFMDPLRQLPLPTWSGLRYDYKALGLILWMGWGLTSVWRLRLWTGVQASS